MILLPPSQRSTRGLGEADYVRGRNVTTSIGGGRPVRPASDVAADLFGVRSPRLRRSARPPPKQPSGRLNCAGRVYDRERPVKEGFVASLIGPVATRPAVSFFFGA